MTPLPHPPSPHSDPTERGDGALRHQRVASMGLLAGGVAHNLNNLLTPILLACDVLDERAQDPEALDAVTRIRVSAMRAGELCQGLLSYARGGQIERAPVDLATLVEEALAMLAGVVPRGVRLVTSLDRPAEVVGDPAELQQVVVNLCVNAFDAMPNGGRLVVTVDRVATAQVPSGAAPSGPQRDVVEFVRLRVADAGHGIGPTALTQLWDPFFTTKAHGEGTGLGLPSTLAIVVDHGGTIDVSSTVDVGTRFDVYLPAVPLDAAVADAPIDDTEDLVPLNVVVIDDDPALCDTVCRCLERAGHRAARADDADSGIALLASDPSVQAVVTDLVMPGADGAAVLGRVEAVRPGLPVVLVSGAAPDELADAVASHPSASYLAKPFTTRDLVVALQRAVADAAT